VFVFLEYSPHLGTVHTHTVHTHTQYKTMQELISVNKDAVYVELESTHASDSSSTQLMTGQRHVEGEEVAGEGKGSSNGGPSPLRKAITCLAGVVLPALLLAVASMLAAIIRLGHGLHGEYVYFFTAMAIIEVLLFVLADVAVLTHVTLFVYMILSMAIVFWLSDGLHILTTIAITVLVLVSATGLVLFWRIWPHGASILATYLSDYVLIVIQANLIPIYAIAPEIAYLIPSLWGAFTALASLVKTTQPYMDVRRSDCRKDKDEDEDDTGKLATTVTAAFGIGIGHVTTYYVNILSIFYILKATGVAWL